MLPVSFSRCDPHRIRELVLRANPLACDVKALARACRPKAGAGGGRQGFQLAWVEVADHEDPVLTVLVVTREDCLLTKPVLSVKGLRREVRGPYL